MANVPWHEEVLNFVQTFAALLPDYEVACEHEHSNCVLIAHKKVGVASCETRTSILIDSFLIIWSGSLEMV